MRRIFKTRTFARWSRKAGVKGDQLRVAVTEMTEGLVDADLGGRVYKKRVALPGRGKSGGARTILGTNLGDRWFFLFGFQKNERANIDARELAALQAVAKALLDMNDKGLERAVVEGELTEISDEEKPTVQ